MKITPAYLIQVWPELSAFSDVFGCCFRAPDADYSFRFFSASANNTRSSVAILPLLPVSSCNSPHHACLHLFLPCSYDPGMRRVFLCVRRSRRTAAVTFPHKLHFLVAYRAAGVCMAEIVSRYPHSRSWQTSIFPCFPFTSSMNFPH